MSELIRVTEVLDWVSRGELLEWRGRVGNREANRIRQDAKKRGTEVHAAIAAVLNNQRVPKLKSEESAIAFFAWQDWWKLQDVIGIRRIEQRVVDEKRMLSGTPDFWVPDCLFDWKISRANSPKWTWHWQCQAYLSLLDKEQGSYKIIQLNPEVGTWAEFTGIYLKDRMEAFEGLLTAYRRYREETQDDPTHRKESADQSVEISEIPDVGSG